VEAEEEDERSRFDSMDDPVRMYMKQMEVPLLTREQEVPFASASKMRNGTAQEPSIASASRARTHRPGGEADFRTAQGTIDRVIVDKKIEGREKHLRSLRQLVKNVRLLDQQVDEKYAHWQGASSKASREKMFNEFQKLDPKATGHLSALYYKQKVLEEMILVSENIHDKIRASLRTIEEWERHNRSAQQQSIIHSERSKLKALEDFVRHAVRALPQSLRADEAFRGVGAPGQDRNGGSQSAVGHLDCQKVHQPGQSSSILFRKETWA